MWIAARHDQALAAAHQGQADVQRRLQPAPEPVGDLRCGPAFGNMETGNIAFVTPQPGQRLLAAAPGQIEADTAAMFDPVGQRQIVAGCQPQALWSRPYHRRQQVLQPALPRRMDLAKRGPRRCIELHQRSAKFRQSRSAAALHVHQRRPQGLFAVAQQAPGRTVGHAGLPRRIAQSALGRQGGEQCQQATGVDIQQQRPEIPGPAQTRWRGA